MNEASLIRRNLDRPLEEGMEEILKAIYHMQLDKGVAQTVELGQMLKMRPSQITKKLKKLSALGLVEHEAYKGARLTARGQAVALEVIRHHRLLELFLARTLRMPARKVHEEAHRLEHVISEELEAKIAEVLGHPRLDPHGHVIPTLSGKLIKEDLSRLTELEVGSRAIVKSIPDADAAVTAALEEKGILPNTILDVLDKNKNELVLKLNGKRVEKVPLGLLRRIMVLQLPKAAIKLSTLAEMEESEEGIVISVDAPDDLFIKLVDLGLVAGARVKRLAGRAKGIMRFEVKGALASLHKSEAHTVKVALLVGKSR